MDFLKQTASFMIVNFYRYVKIIKKTHKIKLKKLTERELLAAFSRSNSLYTAARNS